MEHFNLIHQTHAATSAAPSVLFKETAWPNQEATIFLATVVPTDTASNPAQRAEAEFSSSSDTMGAVFAAKKKKDPDSLMFHEAMTDVDKKLWLEGMSDEIKQLEAMNCWDVIPRSKATK